MKLLSKEELDQMIQSNQEFMLIDVRESYEFEEQNLGGTNIPLDEVLRRKDEIPSEIKVVMCCKSGKRSAAMVHTLNRKFGFNNLSSLEGGLSGYFGE
ncbi:MAG: rhodanese-like domain-containing protein [Vicingaceae bacterium]